MAKLIKILFTIIGIVAVLGTAYYAGFIGNLGTSVSGVRENFTNYLPPEQLAVAGLIVFAVIMAIIYSFID